MRQAAALPSDLRSDRFQVRVGNVDALSILGRLPALFRGELDSRIFDFFFCTAVAADLQVPAVGRRSYRNLALGTRGARLRSV